MDRGEWDGPTYRPVALSLDSSHHVHSISTSFSITPTPKSQHVSLRSIHNSTDPSDAVQYQPDRSHPLTSDARPHRNLPARGDSPTLADTRLLPSAPLGHQRPSERLRRGSFARDHRAERCSIDQMADATGGDDRSAAPAREAWDQVRRAGEGGGCDWSSVVPACVDRSGLSAALVFAFLGVATP
jgi:hypothetical protein